MTSLEIQALSTLEHEKGKALLETLFKALQRNPHRVDLVSRLGALKRVLESPPTLYLEHAQSLCLPGDMGEPIVERAERREGEKEEA